MKITEDYLPPCGTTEQSISEEGALQRGKAETLKEFVEKDAGVYQQV